MSNELKLIKRKRRELYLHSTEVENLFINEIMPDAPGDYVKIYLFCLMYAEQEVSISMSEILNILDIDRETLDEAWNYWEKNGVVRCLPSEDGDENDYSVEFIDQIESLYGMKKRQKANEDLSPEKEAEEALSEADRALVDLDLQGVLREMESGLGRTLSRKEIDSVVTSLKENLVKPDVMSYAIDYCLQMDKRNVNYICKVAENWTTRGCTTMDDVKELLATEGKRWTYYRLVFREMGFSRTPAPGDIEIMDSWLDDMGYTQDQVLQTCRDHAGMQNPSLKYINAVLRNRMLENGGIRKSYASYVKKGAPRSADSTSSSHAEDVQTTGENRREEPVSPDWKGTRKKNEEITVSRRVLREYYEYLRDQDRQKQEERIREVCEKEPLMKEILELEKGVNFSSLTAGGQEARKVRAAARKHRAEIEAEKRDLLRSRGYPEDYLEMKYVCRKCKDTGTDNEGRSCTCVKQRAEEAYRWNIKRNQTR